MDKRRKNQLSLAVFSAILAAVAAAGLVFLFGEFSLAFLGLINGTIIVALIVDWLNRGHDPRHHKPPPDDP